MPNLRFVKTFQFKVTLVLILAMLLTGALCNFLIYKFALNAQFDQMREKLVLMAKTASLMVDAETLSQVPLNKAGVDSAAYKDISEKLKRIKAVSPYIRYIYTMARTEDPGTFQFIVDVDPFVKKGKKILTAYPGDKYNAKRFPEMLKAFNHPSADKKIESDEWGPILSGYSPIRDKTGRSVAILGVDMAANDVYLTQEEVHKRAFLVLIIGIIFSLLLGTLVSKKVFHPVKKLVEGTRHISDGNLQYQVEIEGHDEITELAGAFNKMAINLRDSRKRILGYFYDVVQSLVRVIEARDHYTRGHSERVAEYSQRIALKMGFPSEKIELLKEIALLHDIGKFGIQESILNKKEKLTDEEWEVIKKHPIIGEDILKPIVLSDEMLAMIRGHHERFDGKGYPDNLTGENTNIFAAILSVADAYDAMTSTRAYRLALKKQGAIEELLKHKSSQFNPKVVDAFLQVLIEEGNVF